MCINNIHTYTYTYVSYLNIREDTRHNIFVEGLVQDLNHHIYMCIYIIICICMLCELRIHMRKLHIFSFVPEAASLGAHPALWTHHMSPPLSLSVSLSLSLSRYVLIIWMHISFDIVLF